MEDAREPYEAILLLGPSGVGKTPLGDRLQQHGFHGRRCVHFDFGAQLRRLAAQGQPNDCLSAEELDFVRAVLHSGALLEDRHAPMALRILESFLAREGADASTYVVLNGFPRHPGQAVAVESLLTVVAVVYLRCDEQTILGRIADNTGGDRCGREDDDPDAVRARFRLFAERTLALVEHYRAKQARIETVDVTETTTPADIERELTQPSNEGQNGSAC